ncbi:MAG: hypothetical protein IJ861_09430 [Clostridia bacterium]|nr:hypothetical protein [Clostridia bacterium]
MNRICKAIEKLGRNIFFGGQCGKAVIYPVRYTEKEGGGAGETAEGRYDPHRFFIYGGTELLDKIQYGDTVSDGENEYYVLWTDKYLCSQGGYIKLCVRMSEGREDQEI